MIKIVSTRFNNLTWQENLDYRIKNNIKCIYGSPSELPPHIYLDENVFVVEMNNSTNKIEGIGLIRNRIHVDKYYKIYQEGNYNRYIFKSGYHLNREKLILHNERLVNILDFVLFKGKTHLKRGSGFTTIPEKLLHFAISENLDIKRVLREIFIDYYRNNELV